MPTTLAIDFGARYIGFALLEHPASRVNRVLYAGTLVVEPKPLNSLVETRAAVRRLRRTRKTHRRRLRRLAQALAGIPNAETILRFCRRRGFSHPSDDESAEPSFQFPRSEFFAALRDEIQTHIPSEFAERVVQLCSRHLNEACRRDAELRPARFENRGPTKCNWRGCRLNVPRADNDVAGRLRQSLILWLCPIFAESQQPVKLRRSVDHWIVELDGLAKGRRRKTSEDDRKPIDQRIKRVLGMIVERAVREAPGETGELFREQWKTYYRKNVREILTTSQGGRGRFCRDHSVAFVDAILGGEAAPYRQDISEADLVSRKQQIVFGRIWRLIQNRMLPLAGGRIDRVVVERVALDLLACSFEDKRKLSQEKAAKMYWEGPQFGFGSRLEMLKAEFGDRCAYCGSVGGVEQVEHLFPRNAFPFDSYFNVLPACVSCNARKGARTAMEAGLRVHEDAYGAYQEYVKSRKPAHAYHFIKKGLLNLLRRESTGADAERRLAMLANDLVTATTTQRSPRPLARYLATKLEKETGTRPEIGFCSGRHTALYREAAIPDYAKERLRAEGDLRNHAVDAIILGCDFPSATSLENRNWGTSRNDLSNWTAAVQIAAPAIDPDLGLPRVEPNQLLRFFEEDLGGGYCKIDLAAFNWNRQRKATHQLDPFGMTATGLPLKRIPAAKILDDLKKSEAREDHIAKIAHRGLRRLLERELDKAPEAFVRWLQSSVHAGLKEKTMGQHPADQARMSQLERFCQASPKDVVEGKEPIPNVIGVRCVNKGSENKLDVRRIDRAGREFQFYQAQPRYQEWHVGYRGEKGGEINRRKPIIVKVTQSMEVRDQAGEIPSGIPIDSPLRGRPHGSKEPRRDFVVRWRAALRGFLETQELVEVFKLTQGCVIEKEDGSRFQFRNFDKGGGWMKAGSLSGIRQIHRSPFSRPSQRPG